jgi:hypothetical protein
MLSTTIGPHFVQTKAGPLVEIPVSAVKVFGIKMFFFGGGYLRLSPLRLILWGVKKLHQAGSPLIIYTHPRELDLEQPRLSLGMIQNFRSYINLKSTFPKLSCLLDKYDFVPMCQLAKLC